MVALLPRYYKVLGLHAKAGGRAIRVGRAADERSTRSSHKVKGVAVVIIDRAKPPIDRLTRKVFDFATSVFIISELS